MLVNKFGIVGHQNQIHFLESALQNNKLTHAYLFVGSEGVGKRLVAERLSRQILCLQKNLEQPCGKCQNCFFPLQQHPNAKLVGYEDTIKIDEIRDLKVFFQLTPFSGSARVIILNNAHQFTQEAANAFLKLLEEPPQNSYFFLITSFPDQLPQTIVSRTVSVRFSQVPKEELETWLQKEHKLNKIESERVAKLSMGRPAWALQWLQEKDNRLEKLNRIFIGKEVFQWQDWGSETGLALPVLSQSAMHLLIKSFSLPVGKILQFGKKILEAETIINSTNVSPKLVWENTFW